MSIRRLAFKTAFGGLTRPITYVDALQAGHPIQFVNSAFCTLTGYDEAELLGRNCRILQGRETDPATVYDLHQAVHNGTSIRREILNYRKNGTSFWNDLTIDPLRDRTGRLTGFIGSQADVTDKRLALLRNHEAQERLESLIAAIPGFVFRQIVATDATFAYPYLSPSLARILEHPGLLAEGRVNLLDRFHPADRADFIAQSVRAGAALERHECEFRLTTTTGAQQWFRCTLTPSRTTDGGTAWDGVAIKIGAEKLREARLAHLMHHDALTGLMNRTGFTAAVAETLSHVVADTGTIAVLTLDLDNFVFLNDTSGQAVGDTFLRRVGMRLTDFARPLRGVAARLGGDEFGVLIPNLPTTRPLLALAEALCNELSKPTVIGGETATVTVCIGAAAFPRLTDPAQVAAREDWAAELMKRAHVALQAAKQDGHRRCRVHTPDMDDRLRNRSLLRQSLQRAIDHGEFKLHYQPLVDLATGGIVGAEALVRWVHPDLGLQRPDLFIPIAEETGLIVPLGAWIIRAAMLQVRAWQRDGLVVPRVAINLSAVQLRTPGLIEVVEQALRDTVSDPHDFEFELTEGLLMDARTETREQLTALRAMGFGLVIDDFGTGHSNFAYLRQFPIQKLKIDQTFVRQMVIDSHDASILRAMIALAHDLKLGVVAEGVETAMQRDFLVAEGCRIGQGYLFSVPLAAPAFAALLARPTILPVQPYPATA